MTTTPADAKRLEEIRERAASSHDSAWADTHFLLAIIDRQNAVVEAARLLSSRSDFARTFSPLKDALDALDAMSKTAPD
jgi:hypothetical protein